MLSKSGHENIYLKPDGKVLVQLKIRKDDGSRQSVSKTVDTLDEAIAVRDELKYIHGVDVKLLLKMKRKETKKKREDVLSQKFGEVFGDWYANVKSREIKEMTKKRYDMVVNSYIKPIFFNTRLSEIDGELVQYYVDAMLKQDVLSSNGAKLSKKLSAATVRIARTILSGFFVYLKREQVISINPCDDVVFPKKVEKKRDFFHRDEKIRFLECTRAINPKLYFLFRVYFETLCRRGELLAITWRDIDWQRNSIYINKTLITINYIVKTQHSVKNDNNRYTYVSDETMSVFREMHKDDLNRGLTEDALVFRNARGEACAPETVSGEFKDYVRRSGINENLCLHCTRHTGATELISAGLPLNAVQKIGGWKSLSTLIRVYSHAMLDDENRSKAVETLKTGGAAVDVSSFSTVRKVRCIETGEVFDDTRGAAEAYGIPQNSIIKACNGTVCFTGKGIGRKLSWEYVYT